MIRFAWLQSRTQTLATAAAFAALAVAAAVTGVRLTHLYDSTVAHCQTSCDLATAQFVSHDRFLQSAFDLLALLAPALLGIFWGAPLVSREFESGTYRLAWTQSVTRSRWLITKLGLLGLATVTLAGLLTLTVTWWYRAIDSVGTNQYAAFDRRDIAPIGYAAFAFATGALVGAVIRRAVPAMATTLGIFVGARVATLLWIRPHLLAPVRKSVSLLDADQVGFESQHLSGLRLVARASGPPGSWTLSSHVVTDSGHVPSSSELSTFVNQHCPNIGPPPTPTGGQGVTRAVDEEDFQACRDQAARVYHLVVTYQPAGRYWIFQWLEAGLFVGLALLAATGCYWWVTHRTA